MTEITIPFTRPIPPSLVSGFLQFHIVIVGANTRRAYALRLRSAPHAVTFDGESSNRTTWRALTGAAGRAFAPRMVSTIFNCAAETSAG